MSGQRSRLLEDAPAAGAGSQRTRPAVASPPLLESPSKGGHLSPLATPPTAHPAMGPQRRGVDGVDESPPEAARSASSDPRTVDASEDRTMGQEPSSDPPTRPETRDQDDQQAPPMTYRPIHAQEGDAMGVRAGDGGWMAGRPRGLSAPDATRPRRERWEREDGRRRGAGRRERRRAGDDGERGEKICRGPADEAQGEEARWEAEADALWMVSVGGGGWVWQGGALGRWGGGEGLGVGVSGQPGGGETPCRRRHPCWRAGGRAGRRAARPVGV